MLKALGVGLGWGLPTATHRETLLGSVLLVSLEKPNLRCANEVLQGSTEGSAGLRAEDLKAQWQCFNCSCLPRTVDALRYMRISLHLFSWRPLSAPQTEPSALAVIIPTDANQAVLRRKRMPCCESSLCCHPLAGQVEWQFTGFGLLQF